MSKIGNNAFSVYEYFEKNSRGVFTPHFNILNPVSVNMTRAAAKSWNAGAMLRCLGPIRRQFGPWAAATPSRMRTISAHLPAADIGNTMLPLPNPGRYAGVSLPSLCGPRGSSTPAFSPNRRSTGHGCRT